MARKAAPKTLPLVIAGDGIAAQAIALAFGRAGYDVCLIGNGRGNMPGGVQLAPNAWAALDALGLKSAGLKKACNLAMLRLVSLETGIGLVTLPLNETAARTPYASMARGALTRLLANAAKRTGRITSLNARLAAVNHGQDCAEIILDDGAKLKARWLIGCDGASGISRAFVEAGAGRKPLHIRTAFRALVPPPIEGKRPFGGQATTVWLGRGGHIVHYPLKDGSLNLVAVTSPAANGRATIQRMLERRPIFAGIGPALAEAAEIPLYDYGLLDTWQRGRVVLAGDAAHPMPPHLAQGAGQSLIDASLLSHMLAEHDGDDLQPLLTAWSASRARALRGVTANAGRAGRIFALQGPAAQLRNLGLAGMGEMVLGRMLDRLWAE